ncbi:related to nodulation protein nodB [Cephalotrichum gorgonifer]|uniref:chitin deacetylase n=1 Tax=Cephalotrichum gorgonifer TaxID=2041049 RepID=A0AAE8SR26_9PEZI|nr:related to nodulation protein nodB [Cephalotrichum gorgonifer]
MFPFSLIRLPTKLRRRARRNRMSTLLLLLVLLVLLLAPFYVVYKPPAALIRYFARRWPDVLWQVETDEKVVALTIDDAPSAHTEAILEVLRDNGARATFFVIGSQVEGREARLREVIRGGHELANHAMHDEPSRSLSDEALEAEIYQVRDMLTAAYADEKVDPPNAYFRPGSGFFSDRMRRLLDSLGYRIVLGSIYPHDPQISYPSVNANHILSMLRPGAIIICHDRRSWTVPMLKKVLPEAKRRGYKIVTVTELLATAQT